jgi:hypothetical protein
VPESTDDIVVFENPLPALPPDPFPPAVLGYGSLSHAPWQRRLRSHALLMGDKAPKSGLDLRPPALGLGGIR